jgi:predicted SnoaL-like aldol condensation-catalyzing enzyme
MNQTNSSILHNYFEEVINQKHMDLFPKYFSEKYIGHGTPYVGMGFISDDSSGVKVIIQVIHPGSPAVGKLMVGDEILRVFDGKRTWQTFDELHEMIWGQGALGTPITLWVRRGDAEHEIKLIRGLVKGMEFPYHLLEPFIREYHKEWPEFKTRLVNVIETGDLVAYHAENEGYNTRYGRSAVWAEFGFVRFQGGKITEWWSVEDGFSQMKQLGYSIHEPELAKE